ncbi:DUF4349 domain-containing protein [Solicola sp. PLA-1-18]|uniref:DUF4349 domain-containing protein n=1 Tax=Solicola sp. PLA-1-18 TaxID=3380532 RepID=UPI003B7EBF84
MTRPSTTARGRVAALAVVALVGLTACSGGSSDSSGSAADREVAAESGAGRSEDASAASASGSPTSLQQRRIERKGSLSIATGDVAKARADVLDAASALDGYVADERSSTDDDGGLDRTTLRLVVPTASFDEAMAGFAGKGRVVDRRQTAVDVTEEVVDVDSRVASARASLDRIRTLLSRAQAIGDVIKLESELGTRQAELESLQAQQASLRTRADTATIQVSVRRTSAAAPSDDRTGFLAGLGAGWSALAAAWTGATTAVGALLPFMVALGVPAAAVAVAVRRLRRRRPTPA